jgi:hypothetical protein
MLIDVISIQNEVKKKICTESKLDLLDVSPPLAVSLDWIASVPWATNIPRLTL